MGQRSKDLKVPTDSGAYEKVTSTGGVVGYAIVVAMLLIGPPSTDFMIDMTGAVPLYTKVSESKVIIS